MLSFLSMEIFRKRLCQILILFVTADYIDIHPLRLKILCRHLCQLAGKLLPARFQVPAQLFHIAAEADTDDLIAIGTGL